MTLGSISKSFCFKLSHSFNLTGKKTWGFGKRLNQFTARSTGEHVMTVMVSSHAGLSCPTSQCRGSSAFLPVGMTAVWADTEKGLALMCSDTFSWHHHGWLLICLKWCLLKKKMGTRLTQIGILKHRIRSWQDHYSSFHVCIGNNLMNNLPPTQAYLIIFY